MVKDVTSFHPGSLTVLSFFSNVGTNVIITSSLTILLYYYTYVTKLTDPWNYNFNLVFNEKIASAICDLINQIGSYHTIQFNSTPPFTDHGC